MKELLFPHRFKKIGWSILIPSFIVGLYLMLNDYNILEWHIKMFVIFADEILGDSSAFGIAEVNITNTIVGVLFIVGLLLVGFSKERNEDEYISSMRLSALLWAVFINYILLILAFIFIYGLPFLNVMLYNMFTVLILFIIRFHYLLIRNAKSFNDEK